MMDSAPAFKVLHLIIAYPQSNSFASDLEDPIYACLNPPQTAIQSGRAIALPRGKFQIQTILDRLPPDWQPDLISVSSSLALTWQSPIPLGLERLDVPTVMKLTDSHHMQRPLQNLIEYAKAVGCDYHWTTYNRQHIHFYREAGLPKVFWMPGAINILPGTVQPVPVNQKKYDVIFLGSRGASHPYRDSLLTFLEQSHINVTVKQLPYQDSLQAYAEAKIVFNCSLNGDFNRRVFETLMAGGFLLTDRLATASGLPLMFAEGQQLECYHSKEELLAKVNHYLAHPEQAAAIAKNGHEQLMKKYHPELLRQQLYNHLLQGTPLPHLYLAKDLDVHHPAHYPVLIQRIKLYELLQELHRINAALNILCYHDPEIDLSSDLNDLPRINLTSVHSVQELVDHSQPFQILLIYTIKSQAPAILADLIRSPNFSASRYDLLILAGQIGDIRPLHTLLNQQKFRPIQILKYETSDNLTFQNSLYPKHLHLPVTNTPRTVQDTLKSWLQKLKSWGNHQVGSGL